MGEYLVAEPFEIKERGFRIKAIIVGTNFEQLGPFHHPQLGKFLASQKAINQMLATRRVRIASKAGNFFRRWEATGDVERSAADKGQVVAHVRGCNPKLLEFGVNGVIDVAGRSDLRPAVREILWDHDDFGANV